MNGLLLPRVSARAGAPLPQAKQQTAHHTCLGAPRSSALAIATTPTRNLGGLKQGSSRPLVASAAGHSRPQARLAAVSQDGSSELVVEVGNTYKRLRKAEAPLSRNGIPKTHEWELYLQVLEGDADDISSVAFRLHPSFGLDSFRKNMPGFTTKQTSYGGFTAELAVTLSDNESYIIRHPLVLKGNGASSRVTFSLDESKCDLYNVRPLPLPTDMTFGIELELTIDAYTLEELASTISKASGCACLTDDAWDPEQTDVWRVTNDSSVSCVDSQPDCTAFELVSPILRGGLGLKAVHKVLQAVNAMDVHANNKTAGFHVHVGVPQLNLEQLKKMCQSFVKYEEAFDMMVPPSRRSNDYCASNRNSVHMGDLTNSQANHAIGACRNMTELCELMNPDSSKYFKLNLMPLVSGRQPTVEFRQHSSTSEYSKVAAWVRLLVHFVRNAARFNAPRALLPSRDQDYAFHMMFKHAIKDRYLRDFYEDRADELSSSCDHEDCGEDCGDCDD